MLLVVLFFWEEEMAYKFLQKWNKFLFARMLTNDLMISFKITEPLFLQLKLKQIYIRNY